jgi:hypothetical protein
VIVYFRVVIREIADSVPPILADTNHGMTACGRLTWIE